MVETLKYRAEIDGLRALAVLPVILFHAGFELFSGGFVGVDVFFVISGYLITTILIEDIENQRFSIVNFYERRARRILPALFFVMMVCIPFAWIWMLPSQMKDFSQSLVAVSLFASNILFWRESGYFDAVAEEKPLLHTWSLAVEEQYYVLFPLFLMFAWRFGRNRVFWMIVVMATISLLLSEWGWRNKATANFYLAPTRAWELFAGSLAAFVVQKNGVQKNDLLALTGLGAIVFSIFFYDESTPFPSVYALAPVVGVVLLVLYADKGTFAQKLLSARGFVGVGLISYSAYLWHQPLFAFARIRSIDAPSELLMSLLALASLVLAIFSWKFIETPLRDRKLVNRNNVFKFSVLGIAAFVSIGMLGSGGLLKTQDHEYLPEFSNVRDKGPCVLRNLKGNGNDTASIIKRCLQAEKNFILVGDSHAHSLSLTLRKTVEARGGDLLSLINHGCLLVPGTARDPSDSECVRNKRDFWRLIESTDATVIMATRWRLHFEGKRFNNQEGGVESGQNGLSSVTEGGDIYTHVRNFLQQKAASNQLILINQIPEAGWNVPDRLLKLRKFSEQYADVTTSYDVYKRANERNIALFNSLVPHKSISVVEVDKLVCGNTIPKRCLNHIGHMPLYTDDDHPSILFAGYIIDEVERIAFDSRL